MARIGAAAALVGCLVALLLIDAISRDYEVPPMVVFGLLVSSAGLLSVDLGNYLRRP